jgi:hypothetical protein
MTPTAAAAGLAPADVRAYQLKAKYTEYGRPDAYHRCPVLPLSRPGRGARARSVAVGVVVCGWPPQLGAERAGESVADVPPGQ